MRLPLTRANDSPETRHVRFLCLPVECEHLLLVQVHVHLHEGHGDLRTIALIRAQSLVIDGALHLAEVLDALLQPLLPHRLCKCACTAPATPFTLGGLAADIGSKVVRLCEQHSAENRVWIDMAAQSLQRPSLPAQVVSCCNAAGALL